MKFSGFLELYNDGIALQFIKIVHLAQHILQGQEKVIISADIDINVDILVNIAGPADIHVMQ